MRVDLRVYAIVDPEVSGGHDLADLARRVAAGGATLVQLRDKASETRALVERARAIKAVLPRAVPLLINDRVDVALAAGADGVHVGQEDMAAQDARRLLGPGAIIGLSVKKVAHAESAPLDVIDYAGVGGVFGTTSKGRSNPPIGPAGLREHRRGVASPQARIPGLWHCGDQREQCRRSDRRRRRRRFRHLGPFGGGRSGTGRENAARHCRPCPQGAGAMMTPIAVTIAGSDSGGGAGIQADLKTFSALGVYGARVITALTAQNTLGVTGIHDVPPDFIAAQIDAVFSDLAVNAVKIGMLSRPAAIEAVAAGLDRHGQRTVVLDPVMVAASGDRLLAPEAIDGAAGDAHSARARRHAQPARGGGAARCAGRGERGRRCASRGSGSSRSAPRRC